MKPQDFYVRTRASRGVRVELVDPAGNREWVRIRSVMAEEFEAERESLLRSLVPPPNITGKALRRIIRARLAASLIADWSLPMASATAKACLLIRNPRLRRQIEHVAEAHSLHFGAVV